MTPEKLNELNKKEAEMLRLKRFLDEISEGYSMNLNALWLTRQSAGQIPYEYCDEVTEGIMAVYYSVVKKIEADYQKVKSEFDSL